MSPAAAEIRGVLIPLEGHRLLLPNLTVVEVIGYRSPDVYISAPDWVVGEILWHNRRFPLISLEQAIGDGPFQRGHRARIIICNTLREDPKGLPYIGVISKSVPRLVRVMEGDILPSSSAPINSPLILRQVVVNGQEAIIPDLDALEGQIANSV